MSKRVFRQGIIPVRGMLFRLCGWMIDFTLIKRSHQSLSLMTPLKLYCPWDYTSFFLFLFRCLFLCYFEWHLLCYASWTFQSLNLGECNPYLNDTIWIFIQLLVFILFNASITKQIPEINFYWFFTSAFSSQYVKWCLRCYLGFSLISWWSEPLFLKLWGISFCFLWTIPLFLND